MTCCRFSAALCRGLIEAAAARPRATTATGSFPRLYAAASLKLGDLDGRPVRHPPRFPRLYAAASLKQRLQHLLRCGREGFSAALCRGLIEAAS